jgi:hypothetical protein
MIKINDFFIPQNLVEGIKDEDYQIVDILIKTHEAIARMTYKSLYIIDYFKKNFLYVSRNPLFLCGNTADKVKDMGYCYYLENVPEEEHPLLKEINRAGFDFLNKVSHEDRYNYSISFDFHVMKGKRKTLISHKITPLLLTEEGKVWLAICVVSLSSHRKSGNIEMKKAGQTVFWKYSLENHQWSENAEYGLKNSGNFLNA